MNGLLNLLVGLGLPSAIVAMVLIALVFRRDHKKLSVVAAAVAVALGTLLGVIQLADYVRGDLEIQTSPADATAVMADGKPIDFDISVLRGGRVVKTQQIPQRAVTELEQRALGLDHLDSAFRVSYAGSPLGRIGDDRVRDLGWRPVAECRETEAGAPQFWSTYRVYVGREHRLGQTADGVLRLQAKRFTADGHAVLTLRLDGHDAPDPPEVSIPNKGLSTQTFPGVGDFYIAVREADFTGPQPWAAFSVFAIQ